MEFLVVIANRRGDYMSLADEAQASFLIGALCGLVALLLLPWAHLKAKRFFVAAAVMNLCFGLWMIMLFGFR
jgi:hypothetical protein